MSSLPSRRKPVPTSRRLLPTSPTPTSMPTARTGSSVDVSSRTSDQLSAPGGTYDRSLPHLLCRSIVSFSVIVVLSAVDRATHLYFAVSLSLTDLTATMTITAVSSKMSPVSSKMSPASSKTSLASSKTSVPLSAPGGAYKYLSCLTSPAFYLPTQLYFTCLFFHLFSSHNLTAMMTIIVVSSKMTVSSKTSVSSRMSASSRMSVSSKTSVLLSAPGGTYLPANHSSVYHVVFFFFATDPFLLPLHFPPLCFSLVMDFYFRSYSDDDDNRRARK